MTIFPENSTPLIRYNTTKAEQINGDALRNWFRQILKIILSNLHH